MSQEPPDQIEDTTADDLILPPPPKPKLDPDVIPRLPNGRFAGPHKYTWRAGEPVASRHGHRDRLQQGFLSALQEDWKEYGPAAIRQMRRRKPADYVKMVASLMPKQIEVKDEPFDGIGDDELMAIVSAARHALAVARGGGEGTQAQIEHNAVIDLSPVSETEGVSSGGS